MSDTSTETGLVSTAIKTKIEQGTISLADLVKEIAPEAPPAEIPENIPLPAQVTEEQKDALQRLSEVFGSVVPTERRALEPGEVKALVEERKTLDPIEKMAKDRKEDIKKTIHNHLDVVAERDGRADGATKRHPKEGFYLLDGEVSAPGADFKFKRAVRENAPTFNASSLLELVEAGELAHKDYLAMTTQVRMVDEHKVMLLLKKRPDLLPAIAKATNPGSKTAAITVPKA